jgi:hypothetical protein
MLMEDVRTLIYVAIRTAPAHIKRGLTARLALQGDKATSDLTDHILKALGHYEIHQKSGRGAPDASAVQSGSRNTDPGRTS